MTKNIVIKLGGSVFSKSDDKLIDYVFLKKFRKSLDKYINKNYRFAIIVGGGWLCRKYQKMAKDYNAINKNDLDWIGIGAINLNAEMIRTLWSDVSDSKVIRYKDYDEINSIKLSKPILLCAAGKPGHSSDVDAVLIAKMINSKNIIRLTDVDGIYANDPDKNPNAKKFDKLSWDEYFKVLGIKEFTPGGHYPIDPIAANKAQQLGINFYVIDGTKLTNFEKVLDNKKFYGTIVGDSDNKSL